MTVLYLILLQFGIIFLKAVHFVNYTEGPVPFQLLEHLWKPRFVMLFRTTCVLSYNLHNIFESSSFNLIFTI